MSTVIEKSRDRRGRVVCLHRHTEYAKTLYSVSYTNEAGERRHTVLFGSKDDARKEMLRIGGAA